MFFQRLFLVGIAVFCSAIAAKSNEFSNPLLINSNLTCVTTNIDSKRFSPDLDKSRIVEICDGVQDIVARLNTNLWSKDLKLELEKIWKSYTERDVFFSPMPPNIDSSIFAVAHSFPPGKRRDVFSATIYLKNGVENKEFFYHVVFHELRHVHDFNEIWISGLDISTFELERRAFRLMSRVDEETPKERRFSKTPELWREDWAKLDHESREEKRTGEIAKFLSKSKHYKGLKDEEKVVVLVAAETTDLELEVQTPPKLVRRKDP